MDKYIYLLKDPTSNSICYVGCTSDPKRRLQHYIGESTKNKVAPINLWIRSLKLKDLFPIMEVVEKTDSVNCQTREKDWIQSAIKAGCDLLNLTLGGEGHLGYNVSIETANKIGDANRGRKLTEEQLKTWSRVKMGNPSTKGMKHSELAKKNMSFAQQQRSQKLHRDRNLRWCPNLRETK